MADALNLFPQRAAIGRVDARGNVYMTDEFSRAMASLQIRLGGALGASTADVELEGALSGALPLAAMLGAAVDRLELEIAVLTGQAAALGQLAKRLAAAELEGVQVAPLTDWEHPGQIGARTPNAGTFTTVNKVKITAPAGAGAQTTLTLGDGKTFKVNNTITLAGTDGTTMTLPATSATLARTDAAQTFGGSQTFSNSDNAFGVGVGSVQLHLNGGTGLGFGPRIRFERGSANKGSIGIDSSVIGTDSDDITLYSPANNINFWAGGLPCAAVNAAGLATKGGAVLLGTLNGLTNYAAAAAGTLANAPVAGNPTKWVAINDNGTTRYLPLW